MLPVARETPPTFEYHGEPGEGTAHHLSSGTPQVRHAHFRPYFKVRFGFAESWAEGRQIVCHTVSSGDAPYYEIVVPVPVVRGFTALKVETFVTKNLKAQFPYTKKVDLFNDDWQTVISNSKLGVSALTTTPA